MDLYPLGDQAVLAYLPDEMAALAFARQTRDAGFAWVVDVVQAYTSVAVYYDLASIDFFEAKDKLARMQAGPSAKAPPSRLFTIPCCYDYGLDWKRLQEHTGLAADDIIIAHSAAVYTVYAIGFCPGFPYLGYLPSVIAGAPRLLAPRLEVDAGSVGITGRQTGIYTLARPGGWNIIGRTPLELVNVRDEYFPLRTGDRVRFESIDAASFQRLKGERLSSGS
jgi:inhibitor of KinA